MQSFFAVVGYVVTLAVLSDATFGASLAWRGLPMLNCPNVATAIGYWVLEP